jgi:hypothetical protein
LSNKRAVRKLVEISETEFALLCDGQKIYGFGTLVGTYDPHKADLFIVQIVGHYTWELSHAGHILMRVAYGQPDLLRSPLDEKNLRQRILRVFSNISNQELNHLSNLVRVATEQRHGTMVVICEDAEQESQRLANQSTLIEPLRLTEEIMEKITAIDGAVLIDTKANCYAIGVILDGIATEKGTSSRGARYNSAIRYVEHKKVGKSDYRALAIIISEDRSVDIVPELMPRIKPSELLSQVNVFREMWDSKVYDGKKFMDTWDWLRDHKFYLDKELCDELNLLYRNIQTLGESNFIIEQDFAPNPEMDDSYFIDEDEQ